jgi:hypothetical protein
LTGKRKVSKPVVAPQDQDEVYKAQEEELKRKKERRLGK